MLEFTKGKDIIDFYYRPTYHNHKIDSTFSCSHLVHSWELDAPRQHSVNVDLTSEHVTESRHFICPAQ